MAKACATASLGACGCGTRRFGIDASKVDYVIALAGNPNTGKSTVFNALTGLRQHTGNWPGKTVARAEGKFSHRNHPMRLVDLPGTYSLLSTSLDEEIARDFLLFGQPDVTVVVVDATSLQRNLNLVLQVLEITSRVTVCLNLMDEAERKGIHIHARRLAEELGVPVVSCVARTGEGLSRLKDVVVDMAEGRVHTAPRRATYSPALEAALAQMAPLVEQYLPGVPNARWIGMRLLEGDERVTEAVLNGELVGQSGTAARAAPAWQGASVAQPA